MNEGSEWSPRAGKQWLQSKAGRVFQPRHTGVNGVDLVELRVQEGRTTSRPQDRLPGRREKC